MHGLAFRRESRCTDLLGSYFYYGGLPVLSTSAYHVDGSLFFKSWWNSIHAEAWAILVVDGSLTLVFLCKYNIYDGKSVLDVRMFLPLAFFL